MPSDSVNANIAIARELVEDFISSNLDGIMARLAENVRWTFPGPPGALPLTGTFLGPDQVAEWFATLATDLEVLTFDATDYVPHGEDQVIVLGSETVRVRTTGKEYHTHFAHLLAFSSSKVVSFREYTDTGIQIAARET